jgi:cell division protein FtsB
MSYRKKPLKQFLNSKWFFLFAIIITLAVTVSFLRAFYSDYQIRQEIRSLQDEIVRLESDKIDTLEILDYVKSDEYVEEKARTELNLVYPGEKMMIIDGNIKNDRQIKNDVVKSKNSNSNLKKWWDFFFN